MESSIQRRGEIQSVASLMALKDEPSFRFRGRIGFSAQELECASNSSWAESHGLASGKSIVCNHKSPFLATILSVPKNLQPLGTSRSVSKQVAGFDARIGITQTCQTRKAQYR